MPHSILLLAFFQNVGQTFFQSIWDNKLQTMSNLTASGGAISIVAYGILSVFLIVGVYEVFLGGGSLKELIVLMAKIAMCAFLVTNWNAFFTDITTNGAFQVANYIAGNDFYKTIWNDYVKVILGRFVTLKILNPFGDVMALVNIAAMAIAAVVYMLAYYLLQICFLIWGAALYVIGPLLVALLPSSFAGSFGKTYFRGVLQWLSWPILYALFGRVIEGILPDPSTLQELTLSTPIEILAISIIIIFIPVLAHMIIAGDFAGTLSSSITYGTMSYQGAKKLKEALFGKKDKSGGGGGGSQGGSSSGGGEGGGGSSGSESAGITVAPPPATPPAGSSGYPPRGAAPAYYTAPPIE